MSTAPHLIDWPTLFAWLILAVPLGVVLLAARDAIRWLFHLR